MTPHRYRLLLCCCLFFFSASICSLADTPVLRPVQRDVNHLELKDLENGGWEIKTTGADPYFYVDVDGEIDLEKTPILSFECFSTTGVGRLLIFVGSVLDIPRMIEYHGVSRTEGWTNYGIDISATAAAPPKPVKQLRITMGQHPGNMARIRNLCVRAPLPDEIEERENRDHKTKMDRELTARLDAYFLEKPVAKIKSIETGKDGTILIKGAVAQQDMKNLRLIEIPLWKDVTQLNGGEMFHPIGNFGDNGVFETILPRFSDDEQDRLLTGFALARQTNSGLERLSALHYVDDIESRSKLPAAKPKSLKGIGGCPLNHPDMQELGIASVTFNILLNQVLFTENAPDRTPYEYCGRTWYVGSNHLAEIDEQTKIAAENGWMVSAIVLIPPGRYAPEGSWHRLVSHPDADHGCAFVMPNFSSRESVEAYAAAMNFLAERYSRPDGEFGRIHYWIMHNEINSGFFWTSAGRKSTASYMNLYQKSMRLTQALTRQYDPNAKTLISLDHCWTAVHDPRAYAAKSLLEYLVKFSNTEGNFEWGVAFHPYPQDIANPRTWEDSQAIRNTETPYLTYRNIEVLDAWVKRPDVCFRNRPREIQLTEQGLSSPDYSEKSLLEQAAGMAYTWKKLKSLNNVTAFQYHLWADAHEEGGLKLGLRKYHDAPDDPHGKKPIWHLYKALDTPDEEKACDFAKPIIGIDDWHAILDN